MALIRPRQHPVLEKVGQHPIVECNRCHHQTTRDIRCKRRSCKTWPFCWQHLQAHGLKVMTSTVNGIGNGLFAVKKFTPGEKIVPYTGDLLTEAEVDARYPVTASRREAGLGQYVLESRRGTFIDARSTASDVGRYANHATGRRVNARLALMHHTQDGHAEGFAVLRATRNINGTKENPVEIFIDYGPHYRFV